MSIVKHASEKRWEPELLLSIAWQRKGWVLVGLVACLGLGAAAGFLLPKIYQSSAQIAVVKKRPDAVTGWDTRSLSTEAQMSPPQDMLKSSLIIERAIRAKNLGALPMFADEEGDLVETIKTSLVVTPTRTATGNSFVFKLTMRGRSAEDCQVVLTAVLDSYRDYIDRKHQSVSEDTVELIMRDKQTLEKEIAAKEAAYRSFRETAPLMGKGKDGLELRNERLTGMQTKRSALLMQRIEVEAQLAAIQAARKEGRSQEAMLTMLAEFARKEDGAGRDKAQDVLFPLLLEERKLLEMHGPKHSEVISVQERIEAARRLLVLPSVVWKGKAGDNSPLQDPVELNVQLLEQKLNHLKISEDLLTRIFVAEQDEARRVSTYEIQNDSFRTGLAMQQSLYESLTKRFNEVSLIRNAGGYEIETIESPSLSKKATPSLSLTLGAAALIGLLVGVGLAFWADRRQARFTLA